MRAEAYALYLGLLEEWTSASAWSLDTLSVRDSDDRPLPGALVTLGGALVLQTDARGEALFARTETGPMMIAAEHAAMRARALLLDSQRGIRLTGLRER